MDRLKRIFQWIVGEFIAGLLWSYWPIYGAPLVAIGVAYLEGYQWTVIYMLGLGAFALVAFGLNNFSKWSATRTAAAKVEFGNTTLFVNTNNNVDPPRVRGIKLGVSAVNFAHFPIEVRIDALETQIANRVPLDPFESRSIKINRGMTAQFSNSLIDLSDMQLANTALLGRVVAKISYGKPGKLKYATEQTMYIAMKFDATGALATVERSLTELSVEPANGNG